jgi:hypothetical protein
VANSQALCTSFKQDLLNGLHAFGTSVVRASTTADTFYGALYLASGSLGAGTTAYSATSEVSGTNYTAGGQTLGTWSAPTTGGTTAYTTPTANVSWSTVTLSTAFDTLLIYNNTAAGKNAVGVYTFGSQTVTAGNFTLTMPTNNSTQGLVRIA